MSNYCPFCPPEDNPDCESCLTVNIEPELIPSWEEYDTIPPLMTPWQD